MVDIAINPTQEMNVEETATAKKDAAWAAINTPLHVDALMVFIQDIERLFRINPMLVFKQWHASGAASYSMAGTNYSHETAFEFDTNFYVKQNANGIEIRYEDGIKTKTTFEIEAVVLDNGAQGSKLTITDSYASVDEDDEQLHSVDKSLVAWATDLQSFLMHWRRWSRFKSWRWYMQRVWMPMKPSGRRITYMLLWISLVEIALIALGVGIYFAEYR